MFLFVTYGSQTSHPSLNQTLQTSPQIALEWIESQVRPLEGSPWVQAAEHHPSHVLQLRNELPKSILKLLL